MDNESPVSLTAQDTDMEHVRRGRWCRNREGAVLGCRELTWQLSWAGHGKGFGPRAQLGMSLGNSEVSGRAEVPGQGKNSEDERCWSRAEAGPGAGIADPGGHTAEARRGINNLLHKENPSTFQVPCSGL